MKKLAMLMLLVALLLTGCSLPIEIPFLNKDKNPTEEEEVDPIDVEEQPQVVELNFYGQIYSIEDKKVIKLSETRLECTDESDNIYEVALMKSKNFKAWKKAVTKDLGEFTEQDGNLSIDTDAIHAYIRPLGNNTYLVITSDTISTAELSIKL